MEMLSVTREMHNEMRYTREQLKVILQYIKEEDVGEIETMAYGTWTSLESNALNRLYRTYKIIWLHDDPYDVHLIPKNLLI